MTTWGRKETIVWPPHQPIYTYLSILATIICTLVFCWTHFLLGESAIQRSYTGAYIRSGVGTMLHQHGKYQLLFIAGNHKVRPATNDDFVRGGTLRPGGVTVPVQLSPSAIAQGYLTFFRGPARLYLDAGLCHWLRIAVFNDKSLPRFYLLNLIEGGAMLLLLLGIAVPADTQRFRRMKYGRRLKGPVMLTPEEFTEMLGGGGLSLRTRDKGGKIELPLRAEPKHIQIMGDTGAGKSTLIMQILQQIAEREESAIIYDPAGEFIQRFYDKKRGDVVLNPLDARCPYWSPSSELRTPAEARTIAASLYQPNSKNKGEFFTETPQKVFAQLLLYRPSPRELAGWMADEEEIDARVEGTAIKSMIAKGAVNQRSGVLGSLGLVADGLMLLPTKEDTKEEWSANEWSKTRKGWIFLTGKESEQEALRPLHSLWIDLLILRLLDQPEPEQKRAWFVLDEVASLQRLPQFHTALTKGRKSNNPIIFGYQGKAQVEDTYDRLAEVMLSQPATKFILKTAEPRAAKWASELLGEIEIERVKESKSSGDRKTTFFLDRQVEPLVMGSEIEGLSDLHAFVKLENYVSRFSFPHMDLPLIAPAFVARENGGESFWLDAPTARMPAPAAVQSTPAAVVIDKEPSQPFVLGPAGA